MSRLPSLGPRGEGWVVLQVLLLLAVAVAGWWSGPDWSGVVRVAGIAFGIMSIAGGLILGARAVVDLGASLTPVPHPRDDAELVEHGVYALARHPIYGGIILAAFGWALLRGSAAALIVAVGLVVFFTLKSAREEFWLRQRFPGYAAYRSRTRRFIPWIG
ncbi:MAG: isoprenylcysteine carboxylmethyltransferase family protein [Chloroflexota bacterium]